MYTISYIFFIRKPYEQFKSKLIKTIIVIFNQKKFVDRFHDRTKAKTTIEKKFVDRFHDRTKPKTTTWTYI